MCCGDIGVGVCRGYHSAVARQSCSTRVLGDDLAAWLRERGYELVRSYGAVSYEQGRKIQARHAIEFRQRSANWIGREMLRSNAFECK